MNSDSFNFIESALIFNLCDSDNYKAFRHPQNDFAVHKDAYMFLQKYFDEYRDFPTHAVLLEEFSKLRKDATTVEFTYAQDEFKQQVLFRKVVSAFSVNKEDLTENPKKAMGKILHDLNEIEVLYDEDVQEYNTGNLDRLEEWKERSDLRKMGDGLIGIKTPFRSINATGVGWQPGDLISAFARPTVGKTWLCTDIAATAALNGYKTLLVSTEMTKKSIDMRMDVIMGNKSGYKLSHRALRTGSPIDEEKYAKFLTELNEKNLLICDHISGEDSISLRSIANLIRKHAPDITVIDGVYLVSTAMKNSAAWEQNHGLFYGLKNLALAQDTTIMVSTQATRDAANMFAPPRADQVAFGDALIRASDIALSMCMVEDSDNLRSIQFQKYRDGDLPVDMCTFLWNVDEGEIKEIDDVF